MLLLVCLVPLTVMIIYLLAILDQFSERYDTIVENITMANAYNINFKENMDYLMYIIVVNSERAEELVDTEQPHVMIDEAREVFQNLYEIADADYARSRLKGILKSLNTLEDRVEEIERDALVSGSYDKNMERLDLNKLSICEAMAWCIKFRRIQRCGMFVGPLVALIVIVSIFFIHHHYRSLYHMIVDAIGVLFGVCIGYLCYKYVDKKSIETIEKGLEELKEFEDE